MTDISPINVPADIRQAESVLLQYRNDICIYTEDKEDDKEFYVKLIARDIIAHMYKKSNKNGC